MAAHGFNWVTGGFGNPRCFVIHSSLKACLPSSVRINTTNSAKVGGWASLFSNWRLAMRPLFQQPLQNCFKSVVAISFKQTSSLSKRQLWVQIIVIKVFILLQERSSSPIHIKWVSEEQIRRSSAGLFYSSFLQGLLSPLPYRERYQVVYLFMVILEKGGKCPLDPPAISCKCPHDDLLTICFSLPLSS